jgi:hypothetical protein
MIPKLRLRCHGIKFTVLRMKEGSGLKGWKVGTGLLCSIISRVCLPRPNHFGLHGLSRIGLKVEVFGKFQFLRVALGTRKNFCILEKMPRSC